MPLFRRRSPKWRKRTTQTHLSRSILTRSPKQFSIFIQSQLNAYQTVVITIVTILAPRLLVSMRREYYTFIPGVDLGTAAVGPDGTIRHDQHTLTWDVHQPQIAGNTDTFLGGETVSIELENLE